MRPEESDWVKVNRCRLSAGVWCHDLTRHDHMLSHTSTKPPSKLALFTHTHTHTESSLLRAAYATREKNSSSCWRCSWRLAASDDDYSVREAERRLMPKQLKHGICLLITKTHYRSVLSLHWITHSLHSFMSPYTRDFLMFLYQPLVDLTFLWGGGLMWCSYLQHKQHLFCIFFQFLFTFYL